MIQILTHRGLEPDKANFFPESSYAAFASQAERGFGLEFDVLFADNKIIISHNQVTKTSKGEICRMEDILNIIKTSSAPTNALHLKGKFQTKENLDLLIKTLKKYQTLLRKIFIFDTTIETAQYLKDQLRELQLAPSIAHSYDIERYNEVVNGTLLSPQEALSRRDLFDWVWLDEWDRASKNGKDKSLYSKETFELFRQSGLKIALVSPELHATSPDLLGGESHQDAKNKNKLLARLQKIIALKPDAICTDYPELVKKLI